MENHHTGNISLEIAKPYLQPITIDCDNNIGGLVSSNNSKNIYRYNLKWSTIMHILSCFGILVVVVVVVYLVFQFKNYINSIQIVNPLFSPTILPSMSPSMVPSMHSLQPSTSSISSIDSIMCKIAGELTTNQA